MTSALPAPQPSNHDKKRDKERDKATRKWAYLLCTTTYVPLMQSELHQPLRQMVDALFDAVRSDQPDRATQVGARLVELHCVDRTSLQITVDVMAGPLLATGAQPERVARLLGALSAGYAEALRERATSQQEAMITAVKQVATKAARAAKEYQAERDAVSTELSLLRRQLSHQLLHDALTGLPNRQFFTTRLEEVLNSGTPTTLYRLELNGLAAVNDGLGGPCTDALLIDVAARLRNVAAGRDAMVAHLDRSGFAVLHEHRPSAPPAELVGRLSEALAEVKYLDDIGLALTANIGVVQSPPHGASPVELLRAADIALRTAQRDGPGHWRLLGQDEHKPARKLSQLSAIMPGAVESGRLTVGYRLRVGLAGLQPVAVEAYPWWEEAGLSGHRCVALAEQTGLSPRVGRWLLRTAGEDVRSWRKDLPLSVNLSPNQAAAADLVESVLGTLHDVSMPPDRLGLALPAMEVFDGRSQALDNLTTLVKAGVRVAVHDFHGSPSEVVQLPNLPVRTVSLSPRLVAQARSMRAKALVSQAMVSLTTLVHQAGATVSVDDLRTEPEIDWWRGVGADIAGGPIFRVNPEGSPG
ncbi:EAL domain-containing protein [Actinophytocola sp.]|uniref:EAL domain-containing protein n=1 Tax=Actinophytocola sp. TaxID=1872138 RepID=UPI002D4A54E1|nr:EAL domain-containing protein [Actinophytocola sp.]HYQ64420.1 EAL domain-containing protein [Actinophytocola sp.]